MFSIFYMHIIVRMSARLIVTDTCSMALQCQIHTSLMRLKPSTSKTILVRIYYFGAFNARRIHKQQLANASRRICISSNECLVESYQTRQWRTLRKVTFHNGTEKLLRQYLLGCFEHYGPIDYVFLLKERGQSATVAPFQIPDSLLTVSPLFKKAHASKHHSNPVFCLKV